MYHITIRHKDKGRRDYEIYTKEEADNEKIQYKHWKEAKVGEYALSDDNYVAVVIQRKEYEAANNTTNTYVRVPWGYAFYNPKYPNSKLNARNRKSNHTLSGKPQMEVRANQPKMQNLAIAYSTCFDFDLAIDMVFDDISSNKRRTYTKWMKTKEFKNIVRDNLTDKLKDKGYTEGDVIDMLTEAKDMAKEKNDVGNFIKVIENIQDMLGMRDKNTVVTTAQIEGKVTKRLLDEITEEEKTLQIKVEEPRLPEKSE